MNRLGATIAGLAVLGALAWVPDNYILRLATIVLMYAAMALSWNFIGGMAGYPSFATAAFFGLGAYAGGVLQGHGLSMLAAWAAAGLVVTLFAALIGMAILHLRGHYFAIASLVVAEVLRELVNSADALTGGGMGLNLPILRFGVDAQAKIFYFAMLGLAGAALLATIAVDRSKLGFGLRCIQQNEDAANMLGVNATAYKVAGFALSALFAGMAGAIYASWVHYIEPPDVFDVLLSVKPVVMVLLGGVGTVFGPVLGAVIFLALEELVWRNFLTVHAAMLGVVIVALVLFLPGGLLALDLRRLFRPGLFRGRRTG